MFTLVKTAITKIITVWALRVNETKVTLENAFIVNLFTLGSEKE